MWSTHSEEKCPFFHLPYGAFFPKFCRPIFCIQRWKLLIPVILVPATISQAIPLTITRSNIKFHSLRLLRKKSVVNNKILFQRSYQKFYLKIKKVAQSQSYTILRPNVWMESVYLYSEISDFWSLRFFYEIVTNRKVNYYLSYSTLIVDNDRCVESEEDLLSLVIYQKPLVRTFVNGLISCGC